MTQSEPGSVTLVAVGDVSLGDHPMCVGRGIASQLKRFGAERPAYPFEHVGPLFEGADLVFGNLETALGNHNLCETVRQVFDRLHRARVMSARLQGRVSPQSHARNVMDAIVSRDPEAARLAMRERVDGGQQVLLTTLIESSSLMSTSIGEMA